MKSGDNDQTNTTRFNEFETFDKSPLATREESILEFWKTNKVFEQSVNKHAPKGNYIVYEGPPTANGRPGIHHLESRAFKDALPRYKTMQGYRVNRRAGWDTHGLPVELEVEKQLGFAGKPDIEKFGVAEFNHKCRESVMTYVDEWQAYTDRIGYWVDHDQAYFTFDAEYMESVWWVFAQSHKNGFLYKDYKVLPWCARCGTALSSHELAQGYKDVKDLSVTAKFELVDQPGTFVLAWTTTPWTLPGNVALAVGENISYTKVKSGENYYIVASELVEKVFSNFQDDYESVEEFKGSHLIGQKYRPLYSYLSELIDPVGKEIMADKAYQIYAADFVTTQDGTGVVHTAVMYGQDDFELGTKIGLPKFHLVDERGHFIDGTGQFSGRFVKDESVAIDVIKDLALRESGSLLFSKEKYEHTYPHCWRCKTPLIYYARDSWYIRMSNLRSRLIENNQKINWEPDYIKEGRMEQWLSGVKDWAVSRERYWGTPLPIWQSESGDIIVVDSVAELIKYSKSLNNQYILMRHGESVSNLDGRISNAQTTGFQDDLTPAGYDSARKSGNDLVSENITKIVASPLLRTQKTAETVAKVLEISVEDIVYDERLREFEPGKSYTGKTWDEYHENESHPDYEVEESGETRRDVRNRAFSVIQDLESHYQGETILIISHFTALAQLESNLSGCSYEKTVTRTAKHPLFSNRASYLIKDFKVLPRDEQGELNLHRPYIDQIILEKDGAKYQRVPEVMDVWFDSGSMPWAQDHYPFNQLEIDQSLTDIDIAPNQNYPADYISEAIDQTRGWFYVLQAIAAFNGENSAPYKNVICLGHILDSEGLKMSKSRGNTVNPWEMIAKYGADALRFWMYSVNQPGEAKNFDEKTVDEIVKKVFNLLRNSASFYKMFADQEHADDPLGSPNILDQWLIARTAHAHQVVTESLDSYQLLEATREIRDLVGDLSQWYIRRSRDRFKSDDLEDKSYALATTKYVLIEISKMLAPFAPFLAEELYQSLRDEQSSVSVHLADWSESQTINETLLANMKSVRDLASIGLGLRAEASLNVRQPLGTFYHTNHDLDESLNSVLADELNVKKVFVGNEVTLDTTINPTLAREGELRELLRGIQSIRKLMDLIPADRITLYVENINPKDFKGWKDQLLHVAGVVEIKAVDSGLDTDSKPESAVIDGKEFRYFILRN